MLKPARTTAATASARDGDDAGGVGGDPRRARAARATSSCRSTSRSPRRCSRSSRTAACRCASSASTSTRSASAAARGAITRISDRAVINVSAGGGLLPSVIGRHKRRCSPRTMPRGVLDDPPLTRPHSATTSTRARSASRTTSTSCASSCTCRRLARRSSRAWRSSPLLGDHLHDDARAVSKSSGASTSCAPRRTIRARPAEELAALLDRANDARARGVPRPRVRRAQARPDRGARGPPRAPRSARRRAVAAVA